MSWFRRHAPEESASAPRRQGLNGHQRRALNSTLVHLERQLLYLERLIQGADPGILIRPTKPFTPATAQQLLEQLNHLRQEMRAMAAAHALPGVEEDIQATVIGTAAVLWSNLEDARPATLNRYGVVDPALEGTLGPHIERLIQGVLAMECLAKAERQQAQEGHRPEVNG